MKLFLTILVNFIIVISLAANNEFTEEELEWIKQNPVVKVGADNNWAPFDYEDEYGNPNGISPKYLSLISQISGLKFEIKNDLWPNVISNIKEENIDMISSLFRTKERESFLSFVPFLVLDSVLVAKKSTKINTLSDIENLRISTVKNAAAIDLIKEKYPNIQFVYNETSEDAVKAVSYGKADFYLDTVPTINYIIEKNLLSNLEIKISTNFKPIEISFGINKNKPILQSIIKKSFSKITQKEKKEINFFQIYENIDGLTKEEIDWIKTNPIIKVGVDSSWPPYDYISITGEHKGISADYLDLISKKTGLRFNVISGTWNSIYKKAIDNEINLLACISKNKQREKDFIFTNSYLDLDVGVIARKELNISKYEDLKDFVIALKKEDVIHQKLKKDFPNQKYYFINSEEEALKAVSFKKADIFIGTLASFSFFSQKSLLTNLEVKFNYENGNKIPINIGINKKNKILANIINKVFPKIVEENKTFIDNKWIYNYNKATELLTKEEQNWIKTNPSILFVGDPNWMPFEGYNKKGEYVGIVSEYLENIEENTKLKIKKIKTDSWSESLSLAVNNKVDVISDVITNKELFENYKPIKPYLFNEVVIVMDDRQSYVENLNSISDKKIAVIKEYGYLSELYKLYPTIKFIEVENIQEGLVGVATKKYDAMLGNFALQTHHIQAMGLKNLKIVGVTGVKLKVTLFVNKSKPILYNILDKYMNSLDDLVHVKIKNKYLKKEQESLVDYTVLGYVVGVSLLILSIFIYSNRRLKTLVEHKTVQLKELLANQEKIVDDRTKELQEEKKQVEKLNIELENSKNKAVNLARQKSEFLANMSHEIRTPMNSVIGFTEILDKEISDPIQKEYLSSIKKGGNSLLRIINDILDLSKIEAGKLEIKRESLSPKSLFLEIESIFHSKIISKNITFDVEIDKTIPEYIITDGVRLRQILFNLIGNAIKFTEKGYIKLKIENIYKNDIKSRVDLIFSVEDTGIGIDKDSLKSIFEAFKQEDNHDVAKYGGTGLGLAICTKLVHMLNGEISVESQKNVGSTFTVRLNDIPVSSVTEEKIENKINPKNILFEKAFVMVVDDISENRDLVEASLKDYDIELIMAENGQDALDKLKNINVDLVLMDLRMPVLSGYDATLKIKEDKKLKNIPVVALTASVMTRDLKKVEEYGFDGYLRKPVILEDLLNEMRKFLPHSFINTTSNKEEDEQILDKDKILEVLYALENELKKEWEEIKDGGDFSLIEEFALKIEKLAQDCGINLLKEYSSNLLKNIEAFDIEKVDFLMNNYLNIIKRLRKKID